MIFRLQRNTVQIPLILEYGAISKFNNKVGQNQHKQLQSLTTTYITSVTIVEWNL